MGETKSDRKLFTINYKNLLTKIILVVLQYFFHFLKTKDIRSCLVTPKTISHWNSRKQISNLTGNCVKTSKILLSVSFHLNFQVFFMLFKRFSEKIF